MEKVPKDRVFNFDFTMETAWLRSFKRMKRAIAASEDNDVHEEAVEGENDEEEDEKDREAEIAQLQHEIRMAQTHINPKKALKSA